MKSFDDWVRDTYPELLKNQGSTLAICMGFAKDGYEAGQQSKQAEVDELRKQIDEISNHVEINYDENRDDDSHSYWSGYNQALRELFEILKGDQS